MSPQDEVHCCYESVRLLPLCLWSDIAFTVQSVNSNARSGQCVDCSASAKHKAKGPDDMTHRRLLDCCHVFATFMLHSTVDMNMHVGNHSWQWWRTSVCGHGAFLAWMLQPMLPSYANSRGVDLRLVHQVLHTEHAEDERRLHCNHTLAPCHFPAAQRSGISSSTGVEC